MKITSGQNNLLRDLYNHTVTENKTVGTFRQIYDDGCAEKRWTADETLSLQECGLVKLSEDLLKASIFAPMLTCDGRRYVEALSN